MPLPTPLGRPSRTPTTALFAFASLHTAQLRLAPSRRSSTSQRPRASSDGAEAFTNALPTREDQVALWAAAQFHEEVLDASGSPKETFSLVKACMLIALEEEASGGALGAPSSRTLADFTRNGDWSQPPMPRNEDGTHHGLGAAATWNLQRLDALAAEAASEFYRVCSDAGALGGVQAAVEAGADDSALLLAYADLVETFPTYMITAINTVLFERHGYRRMRRHGDPR